ncbi:hypothetical protein T484DRAFT_1857197 [Baffinella frigidus]|nr:hypothetical protein T484DRAFT_1857197 [Cryptophyta sp. CCMP2293]
MFLYKTPVPKFLRNTLDMSDILGAGSKKLYNKTVRDPIDVSDIFGTAVGTTPRSYKKHKYSGNRLQDSLRVTDITGGRFASTRHTNP